ncbi:MAG: DEAD/DEAH box helicase [Bryobacterales bacterium]|nr:DEAD/DEAH box helicase [Bryobacterales bacterium]
MADAVGQLTVEGFFRPGGRLSGRMPDWENRPGQLDMATGVELAIAESRHLLVEAGTGTGKTLAYLVPLVLAGQRAIVSTGTKNLQEQLVRKDVPFLERVLGRRLRVAVMKGRANFLCLQKLEDFEKKPALEGIDALTDLVQIRKWAKQTETGDRAELQDLPANSNLWHELDARREACTGRKCARFDDCFVTRMHQRASEADLIIANHHLFFADLSLRRDDFGSILPSYQAVVFDEAHELEGIVGQFFGASLSNFKFTELVRDTRSAAQRERFGSKELDRRLKRLNKTARDFFALFQDRQSRETFDDRTEFRKRHASEYDALRDALIGLESTLGLIKQPPEIAIALRGRARTHRLTLGVLLSDPGLQGDNDGYSPELDEIHERHPVLGLLLDDQYGKYVYWLEKRGKGVFLQATPVDVGPILDDALFRDGATAILTSATLAVDGTFDYIRGRLGMHACNELAIPGHFDFRRQALLYLPVGMPFPNAREFTRRAASEILSLLELSRGRAFVLFTSYSQMHKVHAVVSDSLSFPCLMQGQGSNAWLLERFRKTRNCVLFATASFWQGVDVPGEQLSCVIIDKLPFAVPSDPIVKARMEQINRGGGNPFRDYQIPSAVLSLKQGFGRLIRSGTDRGVLALLDNRVVTKGYGRIFLDSLPDYPRTQRLEDVAEFFRR